MAVVIVVTLIVLTTEMIRNIGAGKKNERQPDDHSQLAAPAMNGGDQA